MSALNAAAMKLSQPMLIAAGIAAGSVASLVVGSILIPSGPDHGGAKKGQPHTTSKEWAAQTNRYLQFQNCDPISGLHK